MVTLYTLGDLYRPYLSINPTAYPDGCRMSAHFYGSKITSNEGRNKL